MRKSKRVKLVIMIKIAGASDKTVSKMINCMAAEKFSRLVMSGMLNVGGAFGLDDVCEPAVGNGARASAGMLAGTSWAQTEVASSVKNKIAASHHA